MIEKFWSWWAAERTDITNRLRNGEPVTDELTEAAHRIDLRLEVEIMRGMDAQNALCLSAAGDMGARRLTEQWLEAAPEPDGIWEYHPARIPYQLEEVVLAGVAVEAERMTMVPAVDEATEQVDIEIWHPSFSQLDIAHQWQAVFRFLDATLGEDGVEAWVGSVSITEDLDGEPLASLADAVDAVAADASGEHWVLLKSDDSQGRPILKTVNAAAKRLDHLSKDTHVEATISLVEASPEGLPDPDELEYLTILESDLGQSLNRHSVFVARVTHDNRRMLHYYVDMNDGLTGELESWCERHGSHDATVNLWTDPTWADREDLLEG